MLSDEEKVLREVYSSFKDRLSFDDFQNKINSLTKWNFVRAVLLYQQAVKCKECNPNIAVGLLCSCADAMQLGETPYKRFKEFYERYCPSKLRKSPIESYPNGKLPRTTAPFDKVLHYIYKRFRCLYVHEGIGYLAPVQDGIAWTLYDKIEAKEKNYYLIDMNKIVEWFRQITFEILLAMLTNYPIPCLLDVFDFL